MTEFLNMTVGDALKKLGIEDKADKIIDSNSRGELAHLIGYCEIAAALDDTAKEWFPEWFDQVVAEAKKKWDRPESVYQHIPRLFKMAADEYCKEG